MEREEIESVAKDMVQIAYDIHVELGPGLFESVYEEVFCFELHKRNIKFKRQESIDIFYKELRVPAAFKADILVEDCVILELKSVENILQVHLKQLGTYLKLTGIRLGLLINFNQDVIKGNIKRIVNKL